MAPPQNTDSSLTLIDKIQAIKAWRVALTACFYIGASTPFIASVIAVAAVYGSNAKIQWWHWASVAAGLASAIGGVYKHYASEREKQLAKKPTVQTNQGYVQGKDEAYTEVRMSSMLLDGGLYQTHRHLAHLLQNPKSTEFTDDNPIDAYHQAIAAIFKSTFSGDCGNLVINLALPNSSRSELKIVKMSPETAVRAKGRPIPLTAASDYGAAKAFLTRRPTYLPNANLKKELKERPYQTVLSLPVLVMINGTEECCAVVNVDSDKLCAFGKGRKDKVMQGKQDLAISLCQPILHAIALTLLDKRLFKD